MSDFVDRQAVPILELKHLRDEMDKILTNTTAEQNVKWTCIAMIDDLIEEYDGDKREDRECKNK